MATDTELNKNGATAPEPEDDWENCRGQCGFTPWCKDCKTPETLPKKTRGNRGFPPAQK